MGVSSAKCAAVENCMKQVIEDRQDFSTVSALGAAARGFIWKAKSPKLEQTMTEREAALHSHVYTTDDKLDAICAIVSKSIYSLSNVVLVEDCGGIPAGFYFKSDDCTQDSTSDTRSTEKTRDIPGGDRANGLTSSKESTKKIRDIPHGTRLELIDGEEAFEKASDNEPIKVRAIVEGFIKKQHLRIQKISSFEDSIERTLQQKEHAHTLKKNIKILKAELLVNNPLVNPVGCVLVEIEMEDPSKKEKVAIIAWAGTDFAKRPMDVITDMAAAPASSFIWGDVLPRIQGHASMLAQVQGQFKRFGKIMQKWMTDEGCEHVIFTGHSLGAGCCFLAHMCAICTFYNFDRDREPSKFSNVLFESRGFAGPMVFYPEDAEDTCQTYLFETGDATLESRKRDIESKESIIRKFFAATSRNYVVDYDVIPRLPGHPEFAIPAVKELLTSLGASSIMENLGEGLRSDVTFEFCRKVAHIVHDQLLSKGTAIDMQGRLACYEHFSTLIVVMTDNEGQASPLPSEKKCLSLPQKTMSCEEYKKMKFNPGTEKYNYYIDCHNWLLYSMEYWKRCIYCQRHCRLLLIGEHQGRQHATCCLKCADHHVKNGKDAPKLEDEKHDKNCGKEFVICRNHPCPRRPKSSGEACCPNCKNGYHTQECNHKYLHPAECPTWTCARTCHDKDQPGGYCCRTCSRTRGKDHGPTCQNRQRVAAETAAAEKTLQEKHVVYKVGTVHNRQTSFSDVAFWSTDYNYTGIKIPNGNEVTIVDTADDQHYRIVWRGQEGLVKKHHIKAAVEKPAVGESMLDESVSGNVVAKEAKAQKASEEAARLQRIANEAAERVRQEEAKAELEKPRIADDLPEEWQKVFDDKSGKPYFWNVATNETCWHPPNQVSKPGVDTKLLAEFKEMTLRELKERAREVGVSQETINDIDVHDDPKEAAIQKILERQAKVAQHAKEEAERLQKEADEAAECARQAKEEAYRHRKEAKVDRQRSSILQF